MQMNSAVEEINYLKNRKALVDDPLGALIVEVAAILNGKTSALLTHVSIMIAVSTVFFVFVASRSNSSRLMATILIIEIVTYLILSMLCLMCVTMSGWNELELSPKELIQKRAHLLKIRRMSYRTALYGTMTATVMLIVTLIAELVRDSI